MLDFAGGLVNLLQISNTVVQKAAGNVVMGNAGSCIVKKTTGAATQVTLPARATVGMFAFVKDGKGDAGTHNITVIPDGTTNNTTIDGAANYVIGANYGSALFEHNGYEWGLISSGQGAFSGTAVTQTQTSLTDNTGGTPSTTLSANAVKRTVIIPVQLADLVNSGTWTLALPFAFTVLSALFRTGKPASTSGKAATLTLSTSAGSVTGGVMSLTTANQNTTGGSQAASAISGANATVTAGGTIIVTPSSVTAFVEGDGWVEITVSNNDEANTISSIAAELALIETDVAATIALANALRSAAL